MVQPKYCDMHAVGQESTVETLSITVAKQRINTQQWKRPAFSMRSDPSLHATVEGTVFSTGSVRRQQQPMQQWVLSLSSVHGLYSRAVG
jgi:hypothetical protein